MPDHGRIGALVIGGDHPGLGIARSLGARGIPVYVLDDQPSICQFSRYVTRVIRAGNLLEERATIETIVKVGRQLGLEGWVLFPTRDEHVAAVARYRDELTPYFRVSTPPWETVRWAWDKRKSYELAGRLGIPVPQTWTIADHKALPAFSDRLPLAIKPAIKEKFWYATKAKAWRADTPEQLRQVFEKAASHIGTDEILLQEIIPGDGDRQFSFCAFYRDQRVHSSLVARRLRQHPHEFGRAATYVESSEVPLLEELSDRFLKPIHYYGLVEIEFKHDVRDGRYKMLDVNARTWGFHTLGAAAGVDFPYLLFADQTGLPIESSRGQAGVGWMRLLTDVPTALSDLCLGRLNARGYLESLKRTHVEAVFSKSDPLPSLSEILLLPYLFLKKYF